MTTLIPKYYEGASGSVNRPINLKLAEFISVKDFGAVGDGSTDDSAAIQAAVNSGLPIQFPNGNYLIKTPINLTTANQMLVGTGGKIIRASGAMEANWIFNANGINGLTFQELNFGVQTGSAVGAQTGGFIAAQNCSFMTVFNCIFNAQIPGLTVNTESTFACIEMPNNNHALIQGNEFRYFLGNACGANNSVGTGENGIDVSIVNNLFYNGVDTGVGNWTNAHDIAIVGNIFYKNDYSTAYNGTHIDVAGAQSLTITGNSFTGNSMGIRLLTNLGYTDQLVTISSNTFQNQYASSTEPATGIKVAQYDGSAGGGDAAFNLLIIGNTFNVVTWGINLSPIINPPGTNVLTAKIDNNLFNLSVANSVGVEFAASSVEGNIKLSPGKNTFVGYGAGSLAVNGATYPAIKGINGGQENLAFQRSNFQFSGTTLTSLGSFYCGRGLYAMTAALGTCADGGGVGGVLYPADLSNTAVSTINQVVNAASSNTSFDNFWYAINTEQPYQILFSPHVAGNTDNYHYLNFVRLI